MKFLKTFLLIVTIFAYEMCLAQNTKYGYRAGINNNAIENSFFGYEAGSEDSTAQFNSFFGHQAGRNNRGSWNTFVGRTAGLNSYGNGNCFIGARAGQNNEAGYWNTYVGSFAGKINRGGQRNTYLGEYAGRKSAGSDNIFIGYHSGQNTSGSGNVFIGYGAGPERNITPGFPSVDSEDKLHIDQEPTNAPLIYGEFDNNLVRINGEFEATGGIAQNSDINAKEDIIPINYQLILDQIASLEISEWQYKDHSAVRHIGPMAQDFYAAFGVGKNATTISSVDADGVAFAAIKALRNENVKLLALVRQLSNRLDKIEQE